MTTEKVETKKCKECMADIPKNAKKCSHCGSKQQKSYLGILLLIFIAAPIVLASTLTTLNSSSPSSSASIGDYYATDAYTVSKNYVRELLKSPSTADFPSLDYTATHLDGNRYEVTSYVDSQNDFGATIRTNWTVTLWFNGGDSAQPQNWTVEEIIIDGEVVFP